MVKAIKYKGKIYHAVDMEYDYDKVWKKVQRRVVDLVGSKKYSVEGSVETRLIHKIQSMLEKDMIKAATDAVKLSNGVFTAPRNISSSNWTFGARNEPVAGVSLTLPAPSDSDLRMSATTYIKIEKRGGKFFAKSDGHVAISSTMK